MQLCEILIFLIFCNSHSIHSSNLKIFSIRVDNSSSSARDISMQSALRRKVEHTHKQFSLSLLLRFISLCVFQTSFCTSENRVCTSLSNHRSFQLFLDEKWIWRMATFREWDWFNVRRGRILIEVFWELRRLFIWGMMKFKKDREKLNFSDKKI